MIDCKNQVCCLSHLYSSSSLAHLKLISIVIGFLQSTVKVRWHSHLLATNYKFLVTLSIQSKNFNRQQKLKIMANAVKILEAFAQLATKKLPNKQKKTKNYMHKLYKETKARKIMCVPTWQAYYLPSSHKRAHTYT